MNVLVPFPEKLAGHMLSIWEFELPLVLGFNVLS